MSVIISIAILPLRRQCMLMVKRGRPGERHRGGEQPIDGFDCAFCCGRVVHNFLPRCGLRMAEA
jgi:hypothetical protein